MSERRNDGRAAFPVPDNAARNGMSLRDWFAGQALAGIMGDPDTRDYTWGERAEWAYRIADAMLERRDS